MPSFIVWDDECETIDDSVVIIAACESDAAEGWAEQAECDSMFEHGRRISVRDEASAITKWRVIVECSPTYWATPEPSAD